MHEGKTLGQIAHEAGERAGHWARRWSDLGESQRAEWEEIGAAVARAAIPAAAEERAAPDYEAERLVFEAKWPTPYACEWIGRSYSQTEYSAWAAMKHSDRWDGWIARASHASPKAEAPTVLLRRLAAVVQGCCHDGDVVQIDGDMLRIGDLLDEADALLSPKSPAPQEESK